MTDKLDDIFAKQEVFMELLKDNDRMPEWPVDLTTKLAQRLIKETVWNLVEELAEASFTLKNRMHRMTDEKDVDIGHYREELGDAFAFFIEICILSGVSPSELHAEYTRKNAVVIDRLKGGY